jgi:peptidyl-prolyl cis-trans isomerase SurA
MLFSVKFFDPRKTVRTNQTARLPRRLSFAAGMRIFICFICGFFLFTLVTVTNAAAQQSLRIAAVVNDEIISVYDLETRTALLLVSTNQKNTPENRRRLAPQVLRTLIDEKLKLQEAKRLAISVSEREVNDAFDTIEKKSNLGKGKLSKLLAKQGIPKSTMTDRIRADIAWVRVVAKRASSRSPISGEQVDEKLAEIEANKGKSEMLVAEIFLAVDSPEKATEAGTQAVRLLGYLKKGTPFAALAQNFSQSATAAVGGDLGWLKQGQLGRKLDAALASMRPGQVSKPIRTDAGFYILMLRQRRADPGLEGVGDVYVTLKQLFFPVSTNAATDILATQTAAANAARARAGNCSDMDKLAIKNASPMSGNLGRIKTSSLPDPVRKVVEKLAVSTISKPVRTSDGVVILMVCKRQGASQTALRRRVRRMLREQRYNSLARRYLRDIRRAAMIDIRL